MLQEVVKISHAFEYFMVSGQRRPPKSCIEAEWDLVTSTGPLLGHDSCSSSSGETFMIKQDAEVRAMPPGCATCHPQRPKGPFDRRVSFDQPR